MGMNKSLYRHTKPHLWLAKNTYKHANTNNPLTLTNIQPSNSIHTHDHTTRFRSCATVLSFLCGYAHSVLMNFEWIWPLLYLKLIQNPWVIPHSRYWTNLYASGCSFRAFSYISAMNRVLTLPHCLNIICFHTGPFPRTWAVWCTCNLLFPHLCKQLHKYPPTILISQKHI